MTNAGADTITFDASLNGTIRLDGGDGRKRHGRRHAVDHGGSHDRRRRRASSSPVTLRAMTRLPVGDITDIAASQTARQRSATMCGFSTPRPT